MKQVVGGAFSGYLNPEKETEIIQSLITECQFQPRSVQYNIKRFSEAARRVTQKIKQLLEPWITSYLDRIVTRLFDSTVKLQWSSLENNCQIFSDAILRYEDFGGLFPSASSRGIDYLMSFVVRLESYNHTGIKSKYDVPNGLTEEYLLGFRSGRHDDADIIDTLQEYWHDWGAFGCLPYEHQELFPWDCTEAFNLDSVSCGSCNIAKHVWAFPFDSWSIIQHHLQKDRRWYQPGTGSRHTRLTDKEWAENRFELMRAQDALLRGALAMTKTRELRSSADWFRTSVDPHLDRLKLGGIHRAQPFSHRYQLGSSTQYFLAPWAHLRPENRLRAYEALRERRRGLADVGMVREKSDDETSGVGKMDLYDDLAWTGMFIANDILGWGLTSDTAAATVWNGDASSMVGYGSTGTAAFEGGDLHATMADGAGRSGAALDFATSSGDGSNRTGAATDATISTSSGAGRSGAFTDTISNIF